MPKKWLTLFFIVISSTTPGGSTTTKHDDKNNNTTTIVLVVLAVLALIVVVAAVVYTLYKKGYFTGREFRWNRHRIRSIINPGYGQMEETGDSVSA